MQMSSMTLSVELLGISFDPVVYYCVFFFFFQAEDGIRDDLVTGVQTCALPISGSFDSYSHGRRKTPVEFLGVSRGMHQLFIPGLSRGPIEPTNLLPTGVIITSNKNHKAPSVPRVSVLNQKLTRSANGAFSLIQSTLKIRWVAHPFWVFQNGGAA